MIVGPPAQTHGGPDMALIRIRTTCEAGETCPMLGYDTGDALVGGPVDTAPARAPTPTGPRYPRPTHRLRAVRLRLGLPQQRRRR